MGYNRLVAGDEFIVTFVSIVGGTFQCNDFACELHPTTDIAYGKLPGVRFFKRRNVFAVPVCKGVLVSIYVVQTQISFVSLGDLHLDAESCAGEPIGGGLRDNLIAPRHT